MGAGITRVEMAKGGLIWHSKGCCRTEQSLVEEEQVQEADGQAWSCSSHATAAAACILIHANATCIWMHSHSRRARL